MPGRRFHWKRRPVRIRCLPGLLRKFSYEPTRLPNLNLRRTANAAPINPVPISIKELGSGTTAPAGRPNN